jgi:hypothetical protein
MTFTYAEPRGLPAGLGLTSDPARPRRTARAWLQRLVTRLQVRYAIWAVRTDIRSIPTFVLDDIGIPADEVDRAVRTATLLIIRRAIRARLDRARRGRRAWTS